MNAGGKREEFWGLIVKYSRASTREAITLIISPVNSYNSEVKALQNRLLNR